MQEKTTNQIYWKVKFLGWGTSGKIHVVENPKTKEKFVQKLISLEGKSQREIIQLFSEVKFLEILKHPNIISIIEAYKTKENELALILEFAN